MKLKQILTLVLLLLFVLLTPSKGLCDCAIEGGLCGEGSLWTPCCNPDKFYCKKDTNVEYGTCEPREDVEEDIEE